MCHSATTHKRTHKKDARAQNVHCIRINKQTNEKRIHDSRKLFQFFFNKLTNFAVNKFRFSFIIVCLCVFCIWICLCEAKEQATEGMTVIKDKSNHEVILNCGSMFCIHVFFLVFYFAILILAGLFFLRFFSRFFCVCH